MGLLADCRRLLVFLLLVIETPCWGSDEDLLTSECVGSRYRGLLGNPALLPPLRRRLTAGRTQLVHRVPCLVSGACVRARCVCACVRAPCREGGGRSGARMVDAALDGTGMLVTMLKSMLNEYAQRRHSSHEVHGSATLLRAAAAAADDPATPRRYSEDAQHWIGNV